LTAVAIATPRPRTWEGEHFVDDGPDNGSEREGERADEHHHSHQREPADLAWNLAEKRLAAATVPVQRCGLDGQPLPFADNSYDTALSTWTMCTIPDIAGALSELRRVLKPGGTLHFLEHGLAPDEQVRRWQHRFEPLQTRICGGCHLTRPIVDLLTTAGFVISEVDVFYEKNAPKFEAADSLGTALSP
jgi:SAM-dependent methyltransferase